MRFCGLDFGTSNSTAGTIIGNAVGLVPLENGSVTLPSALFFDFEQHDAVSFGRAATAAYIAGAEGRFMRSVKSLLGTGLIEEDTALRHRRIPFREVIGLLVGRIKAEVERHMDGPVEAVVHGRPVRFVDDNPEADRHAQSELERIARDCGFREISFQFEPIAAALHYEQQIDREQIALIADIGGGTSDFSIVRLGPERSESSDRGDDILANDGLRIGGTDFDQLLNLAAVMPLLGYRTRMKRPGLVAPNHYFVDLATWSKINFVYGARTLRDITAIKAEAEEPCRFERLLEVLRQQLGHALALEVEQAKVALSASDRHAIDLGRVEDALTAIATRPQLDEAIAEPTRRLNAMVRECLRQADLTETAVDAVFLTGGSTLLPAVRAAITEVLPGARIVEGDKFGAVGLGLSLEAARRYR